MRTRIRYVVAAGAWVALVALFAAAGAQAQLRFERGQNVAPVFEGWETSPDGSFTMVFGYRNRNCQEMPEVPVGPNNKLEPGPAERGQQELVWTLTAHGRTDQAVGSLMPSWEIDDGVIKANRGMGINGAPADNQMPSIAVTGGTTLTVTRPNTLTLTAVVGDDGIPGPTPPRNRTNTDDDSDVAAARRTAARARAARVQSPTNHAVVDAPVARDTGLALTWTHYRGPGAVTFNPMSTAVDGGRGGEVTTAVTFTEAGTHILRGYAGDSLHTTPIDVTVR